VPAVAAGAGDYRKDWHEEKKTFAVRPRHDWASHGADAFRYLAVGVRPTQLAPRPKITVPRPSYGFVVPTPPGTRY
jgi:hypothetical protein